MRAFFLAMLLVAGSPAIAGELVVEVRTASGAPVHDAVVSLYPAGKPAPLGPGEDVYRIAQRDIQFSPFVLVVPVGSTVTFPNFDKVRHHVYSFSPAKRFELKLYAREQNRTVRFDKAGSVSLGCNIHDAMSAFVKVSDTALSVKTNEAGNAVFARVPAGPLVARIWHPYLRAPGNEVALRWQIGASRQVQQVKITKRAPPAPSKNY